MPRRIVMFACLASRILLSRLREGRLEIVEEGRRRGFGPPGAPLRATVRVHDRRFWRAMLGGSRRLAGAYGAGAWDSDDLVVLVRIAAREMPRLDRWRRPMAPLRNLLSRMPRNTRAGARRHIAAHYDLGNDLFRLFLDETMTYSCAVFERPRASLREAQEAKLERVCRKLDLGPQDHLLEIGGGWGSFAVHAAGRFGCRVTTTTISRAQHEVASRRVRDAGLEDRVTVLLQDYRDLRGRYDKLVSIEMIEAVGWQYFDLFFRRCGELLDPRGLMLLQAIVIDDRAYEVEKAGRSFIRELIFPSGCLPSLEVISRCVARATNLRLLDLEDITAHYPETLRRWRGNFVRFAGRAGELGYDLRFRRLWELYLAYSEGGFLERRIGDVQALLAGPAYRGHAPRFERAATLARS
jgi:cyclopropane-fatty-acyl-phospholipid synthase